MNINKSFNYHIISDMNTVLSKYFGVYNEDDGSCFNATFIIDSAGILKFKEVSSDIKKINTDELIRLISAFQFANKYSVVCQSNWQPGKKGVSIILRNNINNR